jgi:hypothetical protein
MTSIFSPKPLNTPSIRHGVKNESTAKDNYLKHRPGAHLHECGLVVSKDLPFLGASPDAVLCENDEVGLVECKCPFSVRDKSIKVACQDPKFFLTHNPRTDVISLKEDHMYYAQIQGQLMITGANFCDLVVYTHEDLFVQRLTPDITYIEHLLSTLCEFYSTYAVEYLRNGTL